MGHSVESLRVLNTIRVNEGGEPMVDVRIHVPALVLRDEAVPFVRQSVAEKLQAVTKGLAGTPYRLRLHHAHRSLAWQTEKWNERYAAMAAKHPTWNKQMLTRATNKMIAPYDQKTPPGHATGGAVDVYFIDVKGEAIDLVPPPEDWTLAYTESKKVSTDIQALRGHLHSVMTAEGFSNYPLEFWHYSYGDSAWAARNRLKECFYGAVEVPPT
jgi:D-alanyl-D-alanine dipeptidase